MNIVGKIRNTALTIAALAVSATSLFGGPADKPKITDTLNDFNPEYPIGIYIQEIASNEVSTAVSLSNGVLKVGAESINIAQPSHEVVETNVVDGAIVITTNTYYAVYEDGLANELKQYATNEKITSVVTNGTEVITNWTKVAYLSDIPPDEKKADKIIQAWEFNEPNLGVLLTRVSNTNAPFAYWKWKGDAGVYTSIDLFYKDGKWNVSQNGGAVVSEEGVFTNSVVSIDGFTFIATNREDVMVVYSDQLIDAVSGKLDQYVAKTNLVPIAEQITEERLQTINGIADTLRGIKQVVNDMTGLPSMSFTFTPPSQNFRCEIVAAETVVYGDSVEVDWGDGSPSEIVSIPTNHVYTSYPDAKLTVTIKGFVKGISGDGVNKPFIYIYADGGMTSAETVRIDYSMPIEYFGNTAFYGSLLGDLSFINQSVTNFGVACFEGTKISSLVGMPSVITKIPDRCFANARNLTSLAGMSPNIAYIGEQAFNGSNIQTLNGFPASATSLGEECFENCSSLTDVSGMAASAITEIPSRCFMGSGISSLVGLPSGITNIGDSAFAECDSLVSLEGIPTSLKTFAGYGFQGCDNLVSADFGNTALESIPDYAFAGASITSIVLPSTVTTLSSFALNGISGETTSVTLAGKDIGTITNSANFAWGFRNSGAPPGISVFIATDGRLVSDGSGGWTVNLTSTAFSLTGVPSGQHTVSLGDIEPTQSTRKMAKRSIKRDAVEIATGSYDVDWGDGTINTEDSHTYNLATSGDITIKVLGVLDSLSGDSSSPFVVVDGNPTNNYLHSVDFGGAVGIKELGTGTFRNCKSLTAENIRGLNTSLMSLGEECFAGCNGITNLPWLASTSITTLPRGCFRNSGMVSGDEGFEKIAALGDYSFYGCSDLVSVDFITNSTITAIPSGCFQNCAQLTSLPSLDGITQIGNDAFANCSKLVDFSFPKGLTIGDRAFYGCGTDPSVPEISDDDGFKFKLKFDCGGMTYVETAQAFGLNDGEVTDTRTGIDPTITKFVCDDGELLFNNGEQIRRWEVVIPAIEFELRGVTNGTTFAVANTRAYDGASLVWNWGDGHTEKWITFAPPSHTYTNSAPRNYIVKVKGLLQSISSPSAEAGAYIHPTDTAENPFLVGFKMSDGTPLQAIGSHTFSRCPNLKNIDTLNLPRSRGAPMKPIKRDASKTRLENLSASMTRGVVTYGEGCFARSGIEDLSGLPSDMALLPRAIFSFNTNLASIAQLPKSLLDIEDESFMGDTSLVNLYGWPSEVGYVSHYCFAGCTSLNSLYGIEGVPVTSIGEGAFYGCTNLLSLYGLPSSVETIGAGAFQNSGISSLSDMPSSVTNIEEGAFAQCENLYTTDGISTNIISLPRLTFYGCTNMREVVSLSSGLTNIGDMCFIKLPNLTNVVLGANIEKIGVAALAGCGVDVTPQPDLDGNLVSCTISFPELSISEIRDLWSTNFATTLSSTKLEGWNGYIINKDGIWKDYVNTIRFRVNVRAGAEVCLGIVDLNIGYYFSLDWGDENETTPQFTNEYKHVYSDAGTYDITLVGRIYGLLSNEQPKPFLYSPNSVIYIQEMDVGNNSGLFYLGDYCFSGYNIWTNLIDMSGTRISVFGPSCFEGCTSLKDLSGIPLSLSSICSNAFKNCTALTDISALTNAVIYSLGESAFENCASLKGLGGIGVLVTNIPDRCFFNCRSLTTLDGIPLNTKTIGSHSFSACGSLENIFALSNTTVTTLGTNCFSDCSALTSIRGFPETLENLGIGCFSRCNSLTDLNGWRGNVVKLPESCFEGCTGLTSITGMPSFITIDAKCFKGCTSLRSGKGYWTSQGFVADETFMGCTSLESLEFIDDSYGIIGKSSFNACSNMTDALLPATVTNLQDYCFADCTMLTNIVVSSGKMSISSNSLVNIGINNEGWIDEFGNLTKSIVRMEEYTVDEIKAITNFPFGSPLGTTRFVGKDGYVYWDGDKWEKYINAIEIDVSVIAGDKFRLGSIIPKDGTTVAVTWGDGYGTNNLSSGSIDYVYNKPGTYTIKVSGELDRISALGESGAFLSKYNGARILPNNTSVMEVRIPVLSSISSIETNAFSGCSSMTNFTVLSSRITKIGKRAFAGCTAIEKFDLGDSPVIEFGEYSFTQTAFFSDLTWLPETIEEIGDGCFYQCPSLKTISHESLEARPLKHIGSSAFAECQQLGVGAAMEYWPTNIVYVSTNVFASCGQLSKIYLQNTCEGILDNALYNIGISGPNITDETGRDFKAYVYMTHKTCSEVYPFVNSMHSSGASKDTKFICSDGYISYEMNLGAKRWNIHNYDLAINLINVQAGAVVTIRETIPGAGQNVSWVFGDGYVTNNVTSYPIYHTYSTDSPSYQVSPVGKIDVIKGNSADTPWFSIVGGEVKSLSVMESCELKEIGNFCFYGDTNLTTVDLYSRVVTNIGDYAFMNCSSLESFRFPVNWSSYQYRIGRYAFAGCSVLKEVNLLPTSYPIIKEIGDSAFEGCSGLEKITVPYSICPIGSNAFSGIGTSAPIKTNEFGFRYRTELVMRDKILVGGQFPIPEEIVPEAAELIEKSPDLFNVPRTTIFTTADGFVGYEDGWQPFEYAIKCYYANTGKSTYKFPKNGVLAQNYGGSSIKIGNRVNVTEIGDYAFANHNLVEIIKSGNEPFVLTRIGNNAFRGCTSLTNFPFVGTHVTKIGDRAFEGCGLKIDEFTTFPQCKDFGYRAFANCGLTSIQWMNPQAIVPSECFSGCANLQSLEGYPSDGDRQVPYKCFYRCFSLPSLIGLPNTITNIADMAFMGCTNLLSLTYFPSSLESLGSIVFGDISYDFENPGLRPAFSWDARYKDGIIKLPSSLKSLGDRTFCGQISRMCEDVIIDMKGAKLTYFTPSSFEGNSRVVESTMTVDEVDAAFNKSSAMVYGSEIACIDGLYKREIYYPHGSAFGYLRYAKVYDKDMVVLITYNGGTTFVSPGFGDGIRWCWGDGEIEIGQERNGHTPGYGEHKLFVMDEITTIQSMADEIDYNPPPWAGPIFRIRTSKDNPYITEVQLKSAVTNIGDRVFRGLVNCEKVILGGVTSFGVDVFSNLGTNLSYKTVNGTDIQYKSMIYMEYLSGEELKTHPSFPFSAPVSTVFTVADGYVYYRNGEWKHHYDVLSFDTEWTELTSKDVEIKSRGYNVKTVNYWNRSFTPYEWNTIHNIVGTKQINNPESTYGTWVGVTDQQYAQLNSAGLSYLTQNSFIKTGESYYLHYRNAVQVGPFYFKNGSGYVQVDGGEKVRIFSGKTLTIGGINRNPSATVFGYVPHTVKVYGQIERIGKVIEHLDESPDYPLIVKDIDFSKCSSLRAIDSFKCQKPPAETGIPNWIEAFGDNCFNGNTNITDLTWLPTSLKEIGFECFSGCSELKSLYGVNRCRGLTTIGAYCFKDCVKLAGTLSEQKANGGCFPSSVINIGYNPFEGVCYGDADKVIAVCFAGKTLDGIRGLGTEFESWANQANVSPTVGSIGRVLYYGSDGYFKDVHSTKMVEGIEIDVSLWEKVKSNTGL